MEPENGAYKTAGVVTPAVRLWAIRAGEGIRTPDIQLGKLTFYH